jgi:hypothetical protein
MKRTIERKSVRVPALRGQVIRELTLAVDGPRVVGGAAEDPRGRTQSGENCLR